MIILINGGPGSGKDTLAAKLKEELDGDTVIFKFQDLIHDLACGLLGMSKDRYFDIYNNRDLKELPHPQFRGFSPRELAQTIAEKMIKPNMGREVFVDNVISKLSSQGYDTAILPDLGFEVEMDKIDTTFPFEEKYCVRLHRGDFTKDTRTQISCENNNVTSIDIDDRADPDTCVRLVLEAIAEARTKV